MASFVAPTHTPYQWQNAPQKGTPLDKAHLEAAEQDLITYTQQAIAAYDTFAEAQFGPTLATASAYLIPSGGDDSVAMANALTNFAPFASPVVVLGPGTFQWNAQVPKFLRNTPARVVGAGKGLTKIQLSSTATRVFDLNKIADYDTFSQIEISNLSVDAALASYTYSSHVLFGSIPGSGSAQLRLNLSHITIRNVELLNVELPSSTTGIVCGIDIDSPHNASDEATQTSFTDILIEDYECYGGAQGVFIGANGGLGGNVTAGRGMNVFYDRLRLNRCYHDTKLTVAQNAGMVQRYGCHFQIGSYAFGGSCHLNECTGRGSTDDGIEIDNATTALAENCTLTDDWNGMYTTYNFRPPVDAIGQQVTFRNCTARNENVDPALPQLTTTIAAASNGQILPQATINVASTAGFPTAGTLIYNASYPAGTNVQTIYYTGITPTSFTGCTGGGAVALTTGNPIFIASQAQHFSVGNGKNGMILGHVIFERCQSEILTPLAQMSGVTSFFNVRGTPIRKLTLRDYTLSAPNIATSNPLAQYAIPFVSLWLGTQNTTIAAASNGQTLPQGTINVASTVGFPTSGTCWVLTSAGPVSFTYTGLTPTSFTGCAGGTGTMSTGAAVRLGTFTDLKVENVRIALGGTVANNTNGISLWALWVAGNVQFDIDGITFDVTQLQGIGANSNFNWMILDNGAGGPGYTVCTGKVRGLKAPGPMYGNGNSNNVLFKANSTSTLSIPGKVLLSGGDFAQTHGFQFDYIVDATQASTIQITDYASSRTGRGPLASATAITVGASPYTYTNQDFVNENVTIAGGTVSSVVLGQGGNVTVAPAGTYLLRPGDTLVVTYTAAPTMTKSPVV